MTSGRIANVPTMMLAIVQYDDILTRVMFKERREEKGGRGKVFRKTDNRGGISSAWKLLILPSDTGIAAREWKLKLSASPLRLLAPSTAKGYDMIRIQTLHSTVIQYV